MPELMSKSRAFFAKPYSLAGEMFTLRSRLFIIFLNTICGAFPVSALRHLVQNQSCRLHHIPALQPQPSPFFFKPNNLQGVF